MASGQKRWVAGCRLAADLPRFIRALCNVQSWVMLLSRRSLPDRVRGRMRVCKDAGVLYRADAGRDLLKPTQNDRRPLRPGEEEVGGRRTFRFHHGATVTGSNRDGR